MKCKINFFISLVNHKVSDLTKGKGINGVVGKVLHSPAECPPLVHKDLIWPVPFAFYVLLIVNPE